MRIVLVTSSVTYVRDNYAGFVEKMAARQGRDFDIAGLVLIKTLNWGLLKTIAGLFLAGAPSIGFILLVNSLVSVFADRRVRTLRAKGVPVFYVKNINDPGSVNILQELKPDLAVNFRTRNIYRKEVLGIPKLGCLNIHHGLLPDHRGTMCDFWAWAEHRPLGFSVHWMNEKIDDGEIVRAVGVDVTGARQYADIPALSSKVEAEVLVEILSDLAKQGKVPGLPNRPVNLRVTKTPGFQEIRALKKQGVRL